MRWWLVAGLTASVHGCSDYDLHPEPTDSSDDTGTPTPTVGEPIADAGVDRSVQPLDELVLDASGSFDPQGRPIVAWQWTLVSAPDGSRSEIVDAETAAPTFFVDLAGVYAFALTVQNAEGLWDATPDLLEVTALPADGFYVELSWHAGSDLDLHLMNGTTPMFGFGDCSYCNMSPSWGVASDPDDDPSLDWDAIFGFGPETITIDEPGEGTFEVVVHYYGEEGFDRCRGGCESTPAVVNVYLGGELAATFERTVVAQGDVWRVATIAWPSREITEIDLLDHTTRTSCR